MFSIVKEMYWKTAAQGIMSRVLQEYIVKEGDKLTGSGSCPIMEFGISTIESSL
jgi:hypothetical protein